MIAAVCRKYGPPEVLKIQEIDQPALKDTDVLIKNYATTVSSGDVRIRGFDVPPIPWLPFRLGVGFFGPRNPVLGFDFAGEVVDTGKKVTKFKPGDHLIGSTDMRGGGYAQYVAVPEKGIISLKPPELSWKESAALFFGGHTALYFLKKGGIKEGQNVLIYGASGSLGTYGVQLAKHFGAHVTGVCSGGNAELVRSLGAEEIIDYTQYDFSNPDEKYDIIFDTTGKSSFSWCLNSLKSGGVYLRAVHLTLVPILRGIWTNLTSKKRVKNGVAGESVEELNFLINLLVNRKIRAVIDREYPLEEIVEAHRYVDSGRKRGNVVITIGHN